MAVSELHKRYKELCRLDDGPFPATTIRYAESLLKEFPEHGPSWALLGTNLTAMGRYAEAERALKRSLDLCPAKHKHIPLGQLGHLYRESGNYTTAIEWYQRAIASAPDDAGGYIFLGAILAKSGQLEAAEVAHRQAILCTTGCIDEAYLNLGFICRAQERFTDAADCFRKAIEIEPDYQEAIDALKDVEQCLAGL